MKRRLLFVALSGVLALPVPAQAQQWLSDRRFSEGMGIRVGDLELHPGLGAEFGYDSNYFQRADSEGVIAAYRLRVTPSISLTTLGPQRLGENPGPPPALSFRASAYGSYNELFAADSQYSDEVSDQRHLKLGVGFNLDIAPQRPWGADVYGDFQRTAEPSNNPNEDFAFDRDTVRTGTGVTWRPGGGLFEWRLGYELQFTHFEATEFSENDNFHHKIGTRGRWRFLPRTAILYDGSYTFIRYTDDTRAAQLSDGDIIRTRAGLSGLLTTRLALLGMVGWVSSFYDVTPQDADTFLAQAEAKYFIMAPPGQGAVNPEMSAPTGLSTIAVGYIRDVANSYLSAYYQRDRGYITFVYFLGGAVVLSLDGGYSRINFPEGTQFLAFAENRIDARLFGEYRMSDRLAVNGTVQYDTNLSDTLRPVGGGAPDEDLDFSRWQAYIGLRWFM